MKFLSKLLIILLILLITQGCNTLYNIKTVDIEIIQPSNVILPPEYKTVALKYNNCNVNYSPGSASYSVKGELRTDTTNLDSIASEIYFSLFYENLYEHDFFDSIVVMNPKYYSGYTFTDSLIQKDKYNLDSIGSNSEISPEELIFLFTNVIQPLPEINQQSAKVKTIDPEYGFYSKEELKEIAASTGADALFSLDYFSTFDGINFFSDYYLGVEYVYTFAFWNIYDLNNQKLHFIQSRMDTTSWESKDIYNNKLRVLKKLPPRKDAVLNAADIAGNKFAEFLVPHWIGVQRMYYHSQHIDLKKTKQLVAENKWMEAAQIWKANVNNPNKSIAAKSKFNMALVCEINGNLDAAMDWVVQSYHTIEKNNPVHFFNCKDYIRILSYRMKDKKKIDLQYNLDAIN